MKEELFSKGLKKTLKKMCEMVNIDYDSIDFESDGWYHSATWTTKQERKFTKWLADKLIEDKKFRFDMLKEVYARNPPKKLMKKAAEQFAWCYGWATDWDNVDE